jgi:N-terminal helicase PWI domain
LTVLYCTLLNQAQTEAEKQKIIKQMESDGELLKILRKLQETDKEDIVTEERQRRQTARKTRVEADLDTMDVDDAGVRFFHFI